MEKEKLKLCHAALYKWYEKEGRGDLPWRHTDDPYEIYLSEIMLQQTQVKTVLERYYFPFLKRFPTLQVLADASLEEVLKIWEGLGYYTRARNLHRCAKESAPLLPTSYEGLLALPGIGPNTASAICAFAYHQPYAVMEANVKRILSRIYAHKTPTDKVLREDAMRLLDRVDPFTYNQAMMDIGSMVCHVKEPVCSVCPFSSICQAHQEEHYDYPIKKSKKVPIKTESWLVRSDGDKIAMRERKSAFLHGLWSFETVQELSEEWVHLGEVSQTYSHFKLRVDIYHDSAQNESSSEMFFNQQQVERLPLSSIDKKVISLLVLNKIF